MGVGDLIPEGRVSEHGCSRLVFRVGRWAVKVPNYRYGWRAFLRGLLHNMEEASWWPLAPEADQARARLCPVLFACPGGWFLVMPWAPAGLDGEHNLTAADIHFFDADSAREMLKADNVGWLDGRWVVLDYASR